jgi:hypothetical protein
MDNARMAFASSLRLGMMVSQFSRDVCGIGRCARWHIVAESIFRVAKKNSGALCAPESNCLTID